MKTYYSIILSLVAIVFLSSCTETQAAFTNAVYECKETFDVASSGYFSDSACELCEIDPLKKPATGGPNSANGRCGFGAYETERGLCYKSGLCNSQNIISTNSEYGTCEPGYDCCIYYQQSVGYEIGDLCGYLELGQGAKMAACVPGNTCGSSGGTVIFENQNDFRKCKVGAECCQVNSISAPPVEQPVGQQPQIGGVCSNCPVGQVCAIQSDGKHHCNDVNGAPCAPGTCTNVCPNCGPSRGLPACDTSITNGYQTALNLGNDQACVNGEVCCYLSVDP